MITLAIIPRIPSHAWRLTSYPRGVWMTSGARYTRRPDGTWYKLSFNPSTLSFDPTMLEYLNDLLESGLEPYQAFEMVAL